MSHSPGPWRNRSEIAHYQLELLLTLKLGEHVSWKPAWMFIIVMTLVRSCSTHKLVSTQPSLFKRRTIMGRNDHGMSEVA